jgi:Coenzyme PQQ synthesis protein D (PqqD)
VSDLLEARWRISDQAIANAVADETVILHLGNGTYFGLDPIGARLWDALQAGEPPVSICESLLEAYDVDRDQLTNDLRTLMDELVSNDLVEPA